MGSDKLLDLDMHQAVSEIRLRKECKEIYSEEYGKVFPKESRAQDTVRVTHSGGRIAIEFQGVCISMFTDVAQEVSYQLIKCLGTC